MLRTFPIFLLFLSNLFGYIVIEHYPVKYFVPEYRIKLTTKMKDYYHGFESAKLYFRPVSPTLQNAPFYTVYMNCDPDKMCEAILPAPLKTTKQIEYYIEAVDNVGDIYKTQNFTIPQIELPNWQIDDIGSVEIITTAKIADNVPIDGFGERVQIRYISSNIDKAKRVESRFIPSDEVNMTKPEEQTIELNQIKNVTDEKVDLTGVWSVRKTLSSCLSGLYAHKIIKISSHNGKIIDNKTYKKGTRFLYTEKDGYVCQLIDDTDNGSMVGQDSVYDYKSFFEALKFGLRDDEYVKLLEFSKDKIAYELHSKGKVLTTVYKREPDSIFFE
ncbi:MAG TPA: hypothetical protein EYO61_05895 [Campylobacterales bacterium]|nr:hypothetical protein [Campylobacterales bacterium]HIO70410.1 hypothetical protein [Campylobacterales bacterium]